MQQFGCSTGIKLKAQQLADGELLGLGSSSPSHMYRATISALENGGHAALTGEDRAQCFPSVVISVLSKAAAYHLDKLIVQHSNKQMSVRALVLLVKDGPQPVLALWVFVRRINMQTTLPSEQRKRQYYLKILWHYICAPPSTHIINQDLMKL
uniref:Uncharacterized protein n=2 Tax=Candidatus Kentrum sp. DK TaxID=2126562 RepID=A0A450RTS9_9GAMM|nr:MAG: hypothetical protein BECKDK2373B_GA0170837_100160 [Candidatus Kentron sp. DK]